MKFDDQFLELVRSSTSIIEVIGSYVRLKKSGKDHSALCPFHNEKTPSFWVSENKQIFKCFGCGAGGDVFKFLMLIENLSFPDAVAHAANRQGIPLPKVKAVPDQANEARAHLLELMELGRKYFLECLADARVASEAQAYLDRRGLDTATRDRFGIGYAPSGNQLLAYLRKNNVPLPDAVACGLLSEPEPGQYRDRFRHRVMFPIQDLSGRTIAFGGRILGEGQPKYLNSPETPLYKKSLNLFALDKAKDTIRKTDVAILVEGYFDCVVPFQYGFTNTVASLGTSLTPNQVKLLGRYTRNVVLGFDPDSAGLSAALRSIDLFLEEGFRVNVVSLPDGYDPDSFVREFGRDAFRDRLKTSIPYLDFALSRFQKAQKDPLSPRGKKETVSQILPYLLKIPDRIERSEYVSRVAGRLGIDEQLIREQLRKTAAKHGSERAMTANWPEETSLAENHLVAALTDPEWTEFVLARIKPELCEGLCTAPIFEKVFKLLEQNQKISIISLRKLLEEGQSLDLLDKIALRAPQLPISEDLILGSIRALEAWRIERQNYLKQEAIRKEQEVDPDSVRLKQLVKEKEELRRRQNLA